MYKLDDLYRIWRSFDGLGKPVELVRRGDFNSMPLDLVAYRDIRNDGSVIGVISTRKDVLERFGQNALEWVLLPVDPEDLRNSILFKDE